MKKNLFLSTVLSMKEEGISDHEIVSQINMLEDFEQRDFDGRTLLVNAAACGRENVVNFLIEKGVDVHTRDVSGFTALHAAVMSNNIKVVSLLVAAGCDVNATNQWGNNPLFVGNLETDLRIINLLVKCGADPTHKNHYGVSAKDKFLCSSEISNCFT